MQNTIPLVSVEFIVNLDKPEPEFSSQRRRRTGYCLALPLRSHLPERLQSRFSPGIIKIETKTRALGVDERNLRKASVNREALGHPESVALGRARDFFFLCMSILFFYPFRRDQLTTHSCYGIIRSIPTRKNLFGTHQCHEREGLIRKAVRALREGRDSEEDIATVAT